MQKFHGIAASNGIAVAKVFRLIEPEITVSQTKITDVPAELAKVKTALTTAVKEIKKVQEVAGKRLSAEELAVFDAHVQLAEDPSFLEGITALITEQKSNAVAAVAAVTNQFATTFENMDDEYMRERAADIKDVGNRVVSIVAGAKRVDISAIDEEVVIVAADLTPSDTAQLDKRFVRGFVTNVGGRTSHAAIMARTLEIPAVLGLVNITEAVKDGELIAIDGESGEVIVAPTPQVKAQFEEKSQRVAKERATNALFKDKKSVTADGHEVDIAANIGSPKDTAGALANGAEAIGLFRSEFLYMDNDHWPTEDEQYAAYSEALKAMGKRLVIVRTLDIGGDKTLTYFKFPHELNPFLGYRAIRLSLDKKDIFQTQLRALLRASVHGNLAIMFPMIATVDEFLAAKHEVERAKASLRAEKIKFADGIQVGMMVEIPASAVISRQFARHADFLSIGTNDLIQYTFAADRMSEKVSYLYQPLNPALLALISNVITSAHAEGKWAGMCGEMAGDPNAIPLLVGLGLDEFSMSASSILPARRQIAMINRKDAEKLAKVAITKETEAEVATLVKEFMADLEKKNK